MLRSLVVCLSAISTLSFAPQSRNSRLLSFRPQASQAEAPTENEQPEVEESSVVVEPKEAVKLFGRLAEKYIMLDASGGMCCYSACSDCEYRLPGGGYRMADQSAARPKWIPTYEARSANGKDHTSKWSSNLFVDGPALSEDLFVERVKELDFAPPLGGPYLAASAAAIEDEVATRALFAVLANGKDVLTRGRMSIRMKQLAGGEHGLTWKGFEAAMGL